MKTNINKDNKGFTIIEVLIVLAIAGLILLIVFLAVPALQRNSRNTQRTADGSRVLGAVQEVLSANNGDMSKVTSANVQTAVGKFQYYTAANVTVADGQALTADTNSTTTDTMVVYTGGVCSTTATGKANKGTTRQIAVVWTNEAAVLRCQDS